MNDKSLGITTIPMMAEPEDARLTGQTRNLERRLLALNVTRTGNGVVTPTSWLPRTFKVLHEDSTTPDRSPEPEQHSVAATQSTGARS
jgi:hypothetical protein